jgi:hypothetical protein
VVPGKGVDRAVIVPVREVEAVDVGVHVARRVDHVAADQHEVGAASGREQRLDDGVLRCVHLARVADQEERERARLALLVARPVEARLEDEIVARLAGRALPGDPACSALVHDVAQALRDQVVDRCEQRGQAKPREVAPERMHALLHERAPVGRARVGAPPGLHTPTGAQVSRFEVRVAWRLAADHTRAPSPPRSDANRRSATRASAGTRAPAG